jgi:hypothetical protein
MRIKMNKEQYQKHCEMQANWWIAYATTGACTKRTMYHGDSSPFTDKELIAEALETAQSHIRNYVESCESE